MSTSIFQPKLKLNWVSLLYGGWPDLERVILPTMHEVGVYVIWKPGILLPAVRAGQGIIRQRLQEHRSDWLILRHKRPHLNVTWASVPQHLCDGVERFLGNALKPIESDRFPICAPIPVNLPGT
jgi:hypothetical protein